MKKLSTRSLWEARRYRRIGERGSVAVWEARLPGTEALMPHLSVCTLRDDEDCEEYTSGIWALTEEGKAYAERIALNLLAFGFAWVWPHEANHIRIWVAPMHHLQCIGFVDEAAHG